MCQVWAWDSDVGDESQVIATISDIEANRMVAGGHLRWTERYDGLVVAGAASTELRREALRMLGVTRP